MEVFLGVLWLYGSRRNVFETCLCGFSVVTCDKPGNVTNGMNSWNSEDRPKFGNTIEYLCNGGYTLVGKEKIVCTETGKYDSYPPECQG